MNGLVQKRLIHQWLVKTVYVRCLTETVIFILCHVSARGFIFNNATKTNHSGFKLTYTLESSL